MHLYRLMTQAIFACLQPYSLTLGYSDVSSLVLNLLCVPPFVAFRRLQLLCRQRLRLDFMYFALIQP